MADPTNYRFPVREAAAALVRHQGLTSGTWMLSVQFTLSAGVFGPTNAQAFPAAVLHVPNLELVVATPEVIANMPHLVVDAAEVAKEYGYAAKDKKA